MADTQQATQDAQLVGEADEPAWEEKQYKEALAHLERLQEQIDGMRRTIPSMIEPMARPVPGKDKARLVLQMKTAAVQAVDEVQALRNNWNSEKTQALITKSRESFQKDGDLSKAADISRYGWAEDVNMD